MSTCTVMGTTGKGGWDSEVFCDVTRGVTLLDNGLGKCGFEMCHKGCTYKNEKICGNINSKQFLKP